MQYLAILLPGLKTHEPVVAAGKKAEERVIIFRQNRVELVVVAAGASDRQAEKRFREYVDAIIEAVSLVLPHVHGRVEFFPQKPKPGGQDGLIETGRIDASVFQQIAGNVFGHKLIVGQILIQCADDVIAVLVGIRQIVVVLVSPAFGIAYQIQPVPAPALAELRRSQKAINQYLEIGILQCGMRNAEYGIKAVFAWRQTNEVEMQAANQSSRISGWGRFESILFQLRKNEAVNRASRPGGVSHGRHGRNS